MGNTFTKTVDSFGYKAQSATATALTENIDRQTGARIAIRAFGFTPGDVATSLYFLQTLATTTVNGAVASNLVTIVLTSANIGGTTSGSVGAIAASDYVAVTLDNGDLMFDVLDSAASTTIYLTSNLTDTVASGNTVYGLGAAGDQGHIEYALTASTQNTKELEGGIFFGEGKGYPMILYYLAAGATATASLDYLTVEYIKA